MKDHTEKNTDKYQATLIFINEINDKLPGIIAKDKKFFQDLLNNFKNENDQI